MEKQILKKLQKRVAELSQPIDLRKELIEFYLWVDNNYALGMLTEKVDMVINEYLASRPDSKAAPESDQSKLISKYEELVKQLKELNRPQDRQPNVLGKEWRQRVELMEENISQLESDIAELKTKTE